MKKVITLIFLFSVIPFISFGSGHLAPSPFIVLVPVIAIALIGFIAFTLFINIKVIVTAHPSGHSLKKTTVVFAVIINIVWTFLFLFITWKYTDYLYNFPYDLNHMDMYEHSYAQKLRQEHEDAIQYLFFIVPALLIGVCSIMYYLKLLRKLIATR